MEKPQSLPDFERSRLRDELASSISHSWLTSSFVSSTLLQVGLMEALVRPFPTSSSTRHVDGEEGEEERMVKCLPCSFQVDEQDHFCRVVMTPPSPNSILLIPSLSKQEERRKEEGEQEPEMEQRRNFPDRGQGRS